VGVSTMACMAPLRGGDIDYWVFFAKADSVSGEPTGKPSAYHASLDCQN
jgi:hypothetical protein